MPNQRTSNFKKETATDSKQDAEISQIKAVNDFISIRPIDSENNINLETIGFTKAIDVRDNDINMTNYIHNFSTLPSACVSVILDSEPTNHTSIAFLSNMNSVGQGIISDGFGRLASHTRLYSMNDLVLTSGTGSVRIAYNDTAHLSPIDSEYVDKNGGFSINNYGAISPNSYLNFDGTVVDNYGASGQVLISNGSTNPAQWSTLSSSTLTYYVDCSSTSNITDGSRNNPFKIIQDAIDKCESIWDGTAREVKVAFGSYSENLTISKARIQLTGSCVTRFANVACGINGTITVQIDTSVDMFNSQVFLTGFQINGKVLDNSTSVHTLNIKDCFIYNPDSLIVQSSTVDSRTYLENCTIQSSNTTATNPLVSINSGGLYMTLCSITNASVSSCLVMNGTSSLYNCALNTFTNDNTGNTLSPLVLLSSTKTTTQTIANCGFIYSTSGTRPTTSGYNLGVKVTGTTPICLLYNTFIMTGTSPSTDNIVQCPNTITHYNNACSPANAYKIGGGGSHYAFNTAS